MVDSHEPQVIADSFQVLQAQDARSEEDSSAVSPTMNYHYQLSAWKAIWWKQLLQQERVCLARQYLQDKLSW